MGRPVSALVGIPLAELELLTGRLYRIGRSIGGAYAEFDTGILHGPATYIAWYSRQSRLLRGYSWTIARENVAEQDDEAPHVGHFSRLGGTWWCDTCNSPYCELA